LEKKGAPRDLSQLGEGEARAYYRTIGTFGPSTREVEDFGRGKALLWV
jgi:hypothetical protein